jgi:hypothetical protein
MRKRLMTVLIASLVVLTTSPVMAHYVYEDVLVYASNADCTKVRSEISHGSGGGYSRTDVTPKYFQNTHCHTGWTRPAGYIAAQYQLYKWTGSQWAVCGGTPWYYNATSANKLTIASNDGSSPLCGPGYYGTLSHGFVWNKAWHGGSLWSDYHYLPPQ